MVAPRKLPPVKELRRLLDERGSAKELADELGVHPQTIYNALSEQKYKVPGNIAPGNEFMPWYVSREHLNSITARRLRIGNRIEGLGITVSPIIESDYREWKSRLEGNDFVISYHPDAAASQHSEKGGFFYRPRRKGDKPGIMQLPGENEQPPSPDLIAEWAKTLD